MGGFKWWFRCASSNVYLYEFDLYLRKKQNTEVNLGKGVVMQLSEKLKGTFCTLFFDNFSNSPLLINKLFEENIYAIGTVRSNQKHMPKRKDDKKILRGDSDFQFSKNVIWCKWFDKKSALLLSTNIEGMDGTPNVMRRTKGSATETPVSCPNKIKMYNASMGGANFINQKTAAYQLDRKSKFWFYLRMFFDLIDIAIVNSYIGYTKLGNSISLLDFKIAVAKSLIGRYSNRQRSFPLSRTSKRKALEWSLLMEIPTHLPEFNKKRMRCNFCKNEGADQKTFVSCSTCGLYLCCTKEKNCFLKHHV